MFTCDQYLKNKSTTRYWITPNYINNCLHLEHHWPIQSDSLPFTLTLPFNQCKALVTSLKRCWINRSWAESGTLAVIHNIISYFDNLNFKSTFLFLYSPDLEQSYLHTAKRKRNLYWPVSLKYGFLEICVVYYNFNLQILLSQSNNTCSEPNKHNLHLSALAGRHKKWKCLKACLRLVY